jgi:hypothetical protein
MSTGFWFNQDGLPLQFGTAKAIPELGGDYLAFGENRVFEQLIPLVPYTAGTGNVQVPAPPTTFSGTSTPIAAGIQSMTNLIPLQITAINTGGTSITMAATQMFIEEVQVIPLITATGGTSIAVGLVTTAQATDTFAQVTPNAGAQILNGVTNAAMSVAGGTGTGRITYTTSGSFGVQAGSTTVAGGGSWIGQNMPLVTNSITPLPTNAWLSTIATGTFTNGLIKVRVRYTLYGSISY